MKSLVVSKRQKNERDATGGVTQTLKYFIKLATVSLFSANRTNTRSRLRIPAKQACDIVATRHTAACDHLQNGHMCDLQSHV